MKKITDYLNHRYQYLLGIALIFIFNYVSNAWIKVECLYLDDLSIWQVYHSNTSIDFILNTEAAKIRPILNIILLICFKLVSNKFFWFDFINLSYSFIIAIILYYIAYKLIKNNLISICIGCLFTISHFSYYNISQVFGIMEATALILSILMLYNLIQYFNEKKQSNYVIAVILYFIVPYVHERYIILFPIFFLAELFSIIISKDTKKYITRKTIMNLIYPILNVILFFLIRFLFTKEQVLAGTGGTAINNTFNIKQIFIYFGSEIAYLFGINAGPTYLNGVDLFSTSFYINVIIGITIVSILIILIQFIIIIISDRTNRVEYLYNTFMYLSFIALCILCSSITIRVEMRWVYVSYTAFLLYLGYMVSVIYNSKKSRQFFFFIFILIFIVSIPRENYYKMNYKNIYYWNTMSYSNSLYENTYAKYGESLWEKRIVILNDTSEMTQEIAEGYFQQFNSGLDMSTIDLHVVNTTQEFNDLINNNSIMLIENSECQYSDITSYVLNSEYSDGQILERDGYDMDYWVLKNAEFSMYTKSGDFILKINNIFDLNAANVGTLYINNTEYCNYDMGEASITIPVKSIPNSIVKIRLDNNFSYKNEPDVRELCYLMEIVNGN